MNDNFDIEKLVGRMQSGDEEAFTMMVKQYEKLVYYIAMKSLNDPADAKDVMQETFIEVKKSIQNLKDPKLFKAWLNRVVFSKVSRYYSKHREFAMDDSTSGQLYRIQEKRSYMVPEKAMQFRNNKELLDACILQLKPIYREVILLRYFEQLSLLEIAKVLAIPEGTVKSRINVAKKELKKTILELESKEQIHIDFESQSIEAILIAYFTESYASTLLPKAGILFSKKQAFKQRILANPIASLSICGAIGLGGITLGAAAYQHFAKPSESKQISQTINPVTAQAFPETTYGDMQIKTAKSAYTVLYQQLVESDTPYEETKLDELYKTLKSYGGHYASMAEYLYEIYR